MGTRNRTAGRFQVEALETRWTPGGGSGGVLHGAACHIGEEIPQVQVVSVADGSKPGIASGSNAGVASVPDGSNTVRAGQEGN